MTDSPTMLEARLAWPHLSDVEFGTLILCISPYPFGGEEHCARMVIDAAHKFNGNADEAINDAHRQMDEEWERYKASDQYKKDREQFEVR